MEELGHPGEPGWGAGLQDAPLTMVLSIISQSVMEEQKGVQGTQPQVGPCAHFLTQLPGSRLQPGQGDPGGPTGEGPGLKKEQGVPWCG